MPNGFNIPDDSGDTAQGWNEPQNPWNGRGLFGLETDASRTWLLNPRQPAVLGLDDQRVTIPSPSSGSLSFDQGLTLFGRGLYDGFTEAGAAIGSPIGLGLYSATHGEFGSTWLGQAGRFVADELSTSIDGPGIGSTKIAGLLGDVGGTLNQIGINGLGNSLATGYDVAVDKAASGLTDIDNWWTGSTPGQRVEAAGNLTGNLLFGAGAGVGLSGAGDLLGAINLGGDAQRVQQFDRLQDFVLAANDPERNAVYNFGGIAYRTDNLTRTSLIEGPWTYNPIGRNDLLLQRSIGYRGYGTDVGFHLWPDSAGAPTSLLSVVPGNGMPLGDGLSNLNQGAYATFERKMTKLAADPNNRIFVRVEPQYLDGNMSRRPDTIVVSHRVNDGDWSDPQDFPNKH